MEDDIKSIRQLLEAERSVENGGGICLECKYWKGKCTAISILPEIHRKFGCTLGYTIGCSGFERKQTLNNGV